MTNNTILNYCLTDNSFLKSEGPSKYILPVSEEEKQQLLEHQEKARTYDIVSGDFRISQLINMVEHSLLQMNYTDENFDKISNLNEKLLQDNNSLIRKLRDTKHSKEKVQN